MLKKYVERVKKVDEVQIAMIMMVDQAKMQARRLNEQGKEKILEIFASL